MPKKSFYQKEKLYFESKQKFRNWLKKNYNKSDGFWMIIHKKNSTVKSISYSEAVGEALCYGWIDSLINKNDVISFLQYFAPRKPKSPWSRVNKNKIKALLEKGLIEKPGLEKIERAKLDGSWSLYDDVEDLKFPQDFILMLEKDIEAKNNFSKFSDSSKKAILWWILSAKTEKTRTDRILKTIELAEKNIRAR